MKTADIQSFVHEVLAAMLLPYSRHVIGDAMHLVQSTPRFRQRYEILCNRFGKAVVNKACGRWIAAAFGKHGKAKVSAGRGSLIASYSLLEVEGLCETA